METIEIKWQRLIVDGDTCTRCGQTGREVEEAVSVLKQALAPLGFEIDFVKKTLSAAEFEAAPDESNMIFIDQISLEKWLDAETQTSLCCDVCGEKQCRTVVYDDREYETIPAALIIKSALFAVAGRLEPENKSECSSGSEDCCS